MLQLLSLGFPFFAASAAAGDSLIEFVFYETLENIAAWDAGIAVWRAKRKYDAVRPFTAIREVYGDSLVRALLPLSTQACTVQNWLPSSQP